MDERLYTMTETARELNLTIKTVYKYSTNGELKTMLFGKKQRLTTKAFMDEFRKTHKDLFRHSEYSKGINKK